MTYIAKTMSTPANDHFDAEIAGEWASSVTWIKLKVMNTSLLGNKGYVEFTAYFEDSKRRQALHELSEFHLINGAWFYVEAHKPKKRR